MHQVLTVLGAAPVRCVSADREFIGHDWVQGLEQQPVASAMRIRDNALITRTKGPIPLRQVFRDLAIAQERVLRNPRQVYGHALCLAVLRLSEAGLLIVASNQPGQRALEQYKQRWGIECSPP
ncbi:MAG: hypothetical protein HY710_10260 [Candidatus Latescibacteria bacterium]|nr:hypothetical protein [Candidatus Latescibacterota bacterium]